MQRDFSFNLIPYSAWNSNIRSQLGKETWDVIRRYIYQRAGWECEICGGKGDQWPVECHEEWGFIDGIQYLKDLMALCPLCHKGKHLGRTIALDSQETIDRVIRHLLRVTGYSIGQLQREYLDAREECRRTQEIEYINIDDELPVLAEIEYITGRSLYSDDFEEEDEEEEEDEPLYF